MNLGHTDIAKFLLAHGADVNASGATFVAIEHIRVVRWRASSEA
jgi:ankyrin repeat protein